MAISYDEITAGSNQTVYNFNFDYIEASDVKVKLNGTDTSAYTLSGQKEVTLTTAPTQNTVVRIYRDTNSTTLEKTFVSGSTLKAEELNANFKQSLYVTQETTREVAESNAGSVITQATNAVNTANAASTTATNAENTANGIAATANTALSTANTASTTASTALTNVNNKADIGANVSTFANDSNYISKGTNNTLPADVIINSNQNITTSGSLNAGTTTTGATTASSIAVTNEIVLSEGTTTDKGLRFPPNIGGGTGDTAYIRHYVPTGSGEATRLHIANENDADDDIYLQSGLVYTSGNFTATGTCTANSFSGNGANLTGIAVPPISKVAYVRQSGDSTAPSGTTSWNTAGSLTRTVTAVTNDTFVWVQWYLQFTTTTSTANTSNRAMYRIRLYKNGSYVKDVLPEVSTQMTSQSTTTNEQAFKLVQDGTGDFTTGEQIEIRVQYRNYASGTSRRTVLKSGGHLAVFLVDVN